LQQGEAGVCGGMTGVFVIEDSRAGGKRGRLTFREAGAPKHFLPGGGTDPRGAGG